MSNGNLSKKKGIVVRFEELTEEEKEQLRGEAGKNGYTPVKGVDYFTEEDIASLNIPDKAALEMVLIEVGECYPVAFQNQARIEALGAEKADVWYVDNKFDELDIPNDEVYSLHYYGDKELKPNVKVTLRPVYDEDGWLITEEVDIVKLDNYPKNGDTVVLPKTEGNLFMFQKGKFLESDGAEADGSKVKKVIAPRLDADEDPDLHSVYKDTFDSFFPNLETLVNCDRATKEYVDANIEKINKELSNLLTDDGLLNDRISAVENSVGDIDTALDSILALQSSYMGGDNV